MRIVGVYPLQKQCLQEYPFSNSVFVDEQLNV